MGIDRGGKDRKKEGNNSQETIGNKKNREGNSKNDLIKEIEEDYSFILKDKKLLEIDYVPGEDRIVGRDEMMKKVGKELYPLVKNQPANNCLIYGETGTGKSLVAKYVSRTIKDEAVNNGYNVGVAYINCSNYTHTETVRNICLNLLEKLDTSIDIPSSGISTGQYYRYLWNIVDGYDSVIIILDEIDMLDSDSILLELSRAKEPENVDQDKNICFIAITNRINYEETLTERVRSSLDEKRFVFDPYDAVQVKQILENRKDAFYDDVLGENVIPKTAALSAKDYGDARKAIKVLKKAGEIAESRKDEMVEERHVDMAKDEAEKDMVRELLQGVTNHTKTVLFVLSELSLNSNNEYIKSSKIYNSYINIYEKNSGDPVSKNRVWQILNEQEFLNVIESKKEQLENGGIAKKHRLLYDPELVKDITKDVVEDYKIDII